jgi:AraC-like DNA-binding protein
MEVAIMTAVLQKIHPLFSIDCVQHNEHYAMPITHSHSHYELYILEQGHHEMLVNDALIDVAMHEIVLLKPNVFHRSVGNCGCKRTCIYFTERFLRLYFTEKALANLLNCFSREVVVLDKETFPRLKKLLLLLEKEDVDHRNHTIFIYLADILNIINKHGAVKEDNSAALKGEGIAAILSYINQNYNKVHHIEQIAEQFFISKYYLCKIFKEATGLTLVQYINNIKLQNACNMLSNTKRSVSEIAEACGFNSAMYFCKLFKQTLMVTPSQFRKSAML